MESPKQIIKTLLSGSGKSAEFTRFLLVGTVNTAVTYLLYLAGLFLGATPVWAYNIAFISGIALAYFLNLKVTFRQKHHWQKMLRFPLVYLAQYVIGVFSLQFFLSLGIAAEFAGLFVLPIVVPIGFVLSRLFLR